MKDNKIIKVNEDVSWIGVLDPDLETFDVVMETEYGTTYNSYFINAEKKAVVETVKEPFQQTYLEKISQVVNPEQIEYIIMNHTEPDHSGSLSALLELAPNATVVASANAVRYLKDMVNVPFKSRVVKNDDTLDLGNKTLRFINAPNLHWPDTMFSYLEEDQLLFTCDSFGAHYCDEKMIDSEVDPEKHADSFQYYFDVILKPFSKFMLQAVEKIRPLDIKAVLPGHGPMLLHDWKKWVDKSEVDAKNYLSFPKKHHVFIPYVSAYQYTGKIAEKIAEGIRSVDDVEVEVVDIEHMPVGEMEGRLTRADAFMVGSTTINQNILLPVYKLLAVVNPIRDKGKPVGMFGSYGWSGEARKILAAALQVLKLKPFGDGVFVKLKPSVEDETLAFNYGKDFALDLVKK